LIFLAARGALKDTLTPMAKRETSNTSQVNADMRVVVLTGKDSLLRLERSHALEADLKKQFGSVDRFDFDGATTSLATVLDELRTTTGESVQLYMREGDGRRCVVSLESPHGLRWIVPEGSLLPLGAGSAGHVLAGERVDKRGWIQSIGEREAGVASVSAPVVNAQGIVVAAISVSGPIERLSRKPGERHGIAVVKAAKDLAMLL
jgi:hypothetical protein